MEEIQKKLDRLARIDAKNKARVARFIEKQKSLGKRQINAMIEGKAFEIISNERNKSIEQGSPLSVASIIENALYTTYNKNVNSDITKNSNAKKPITNLNQNKAQLTTSTPKPIKQPQNQLKTKTDTDTLKTNNDDLNKEIIALCRELKITYQNDKTRHKQVYKQALIKAKTFFKGKEITDNKITEILNQGS